MVIADKSSHFGKARVTVLGSAELWLATLLGIDPHTSKLIKGKRLSTLANTLLLKDRRMLVLAPYQEGNHYNWKSKNQSATYRYHDIRHPLYGVVKDLSTRTSIRPLSLLHLVLCDVVQAQGSVSSCMCYFLSLAIKTCPGNHFIHHFT